MATVRRITKAASAPARRGRPPRKAAAEKAAPVQEGRDVTVYADKPASDYHKAFANWIVRHVGYSPDEAASKKSAFLAGVSIATAARPAFMESDYLQEWREKNNVAKRGPKGGSPAKAAPASQRRKPEPEVEEDDEFEDEEEELEDDEFEEEDDEFEEDDAEEDEEFEEEEEETPPPTRRRRTAKAAPAKATRTTRAKAKPADDDDFIF